MSGSRNFCQGRSRSVWQKELWQRFFFKVPEGVGEVQLFPGGGGGGGGGGGNWLFPIETHITCDFPGGVGVRTPCPLLWIRTWIPEREHYKIGSVRHRSLQVGQFELTDVSDYLSRNIHSAFEYYSCKIVLESVLFRSVTDGRVNAISPSFELEINSHSYSLTVVWFVY